MRVPDYILDCVGFLGDVVPESESDSFNHEATVFVVSVPSAVPNAGSYHYLVTAKHSIVGRRNLAMLMNTAGGKDLILPDDHSEQWWFHPSDTTTDIAVTCLQPSSSLNFTSIPIDLLLTPERIKERNIGIGDELFFPGLFQKAVGNQKNTPILRMGNLAMFPNEPIWVDLTEFKRGFMEAYLCEARSIKGISGSPVFVKETLTFGVREKDGAIIQVQGASKFHLLGLMHGHWDVKESELNSVEIIPSARGVNVGIAVIVPAYKIIETLNQPVLLAQREQADEALRRRITPTPD